MLKYQDLPMPSILMNVPFVDLALTSVPNTPLGSNISVVCSCEMVRRPDASLGMWHGEIRNAKSAWGVNVVPAICRETRSHIPELWLPRGELENRFVL